MPRADVKADASADFLVRKPPSGVRAAYGVWVVVLGFMRGVLNGWGDCEFEAQGFDDFEYGFCIGNALAAEAFVEAFA